MLTPKEAFKKAKPIEEIAKKNAAIEKTKRHGELKRTMRNDMGRKYQEARKEADERINAAHVLIEKKVAKGKMRLTVELFQCIKSRDDEISLVDKLVFRRFHDLGFKPVLNWESDGFEGVTFTKWVCWNMALSWDMGGWYE